MSLQIEVNSICRLVKYFIQIPSTKVRVKINSILLSAVIVIEHRTVISVVLRTGKDREVHFILDYSRPSPV